MDNFWLAVGVTAFAGLSTGIGSAIAFFAKRQSPRFLSVATGFSAGVMLYVSFTEILSKTNDALAEEWSAAAARWGTAGAFFGGLLLMLLIDRLIPAPENPHEVRSAKQVDALHREEAGPPPPEMHAPHHLMRMGLFTALAIGIHNFPEGLATFLAVLKDPALGMAIAVAIALHNIPEGISVAVPIYYATGKRGKAFAWSMVSGLAEPVGGILGYLVLKSFLSQTTMGIAFGSVAGIMVYISLDELLPTSRAYGKGHDSLYGLMAGMAVMALSLLLLA
jgi:ZIP family zinc transporter